jgi:hypothetical protein
MMDVKKYVYGLLSNSSALISALGTGSIVYAFPQTFAVLPIVSYEETNQRSTDDNYGDDFSLGCESDIQIDVWTKFETSTTAIVKIVDSIMESALFNIDFSGDFNEPENRIQHRVIRYSKKFLAGEI